MDQVTLNWAKQTGAGAGQSAGSLPDLGKAESLLNQVQRKRKISKQAKQVKAQSQQQLKPQFLLKRKYLQTPADYLTIQL